MEELATYHEILIVLKRFPDMFYTALLALFGLDKLVHVMQ